MNKRQTLLAKILTVIVIGSNTVVQLAKDEDVILGTIWVTYLFGTVISSIIYVGFKGKGWIAR